MTSSQDTCSMKAKIICNCKISYFLRSNIYILWYISFVHWCNLHLLILVINIKNEFDFFYYFSIYLFTMNWPIICLLKFLVLNEICFCIPSIIEFHIILIYVQFWWNLFWWFLKLSILIMLIICNIFLSF